VKQKTTEEKLGDLIRRMGSPHEGEVTASALALRRALAASGRDFHYIAELVEIGGNGKLSKDEMKLIYDHGYDAGYDAGLKEGEKRNVPTFRRVDSSGAYEMAQYCWERRHRLPPRHRAFIEDMIELAGECELSPKQQNYLRSLYRRLGGKL
jgi:hypothetical protein